MILAFGRRAAARLASLAQAGAVLLFLLSLLFLDPVRGFVVDGLRRGDAATAGLLWFPPAWFLGLYEFIAGTPRPLMTSLALRGVAAGVLPFAITVAIYAFGYKRLLARAVEAPPRSTRFALVALVSQHRARRYSSGSRKSRRSARSCCAPSRGAAVTAC